MCAFPRLPGLDTVNGLHEPFLAIEKVTKVTTEYHFEEALQRLRNAMQYIKERELH